MNIVEEMAAMEAFHESVGMKIHYLPVEDMATFEVKDSHQLEAIIKNEGYKVVVSNFSFPCRIVALYDNKNSICYLHSMEEAKEIMKKIIDNLFD